jgi:oxygen-independent coproporphyrinogen-3 oxidase
MEADIGTYVECLKKEIKMVSDSCKGYQIRTIFIGGGTPSYIDSKHISGILKECKANFNIDNDAEISMESNPGTLSLSGLDEYIGAGVNRLSIGLQAVQDKLLCTLGRIHDFEQFLEGYRYAREAGFKNINVDLMFGLPGQTTSDWRDTLERICSLKPEHLSCYSLKIEENTPFHGVYGFDLKRSEGVEDLPSEDEEREMYHYAIEYLKTNNYKHYEISNFALEGYECKHNLIYWKHEPYIGIGAGAHSYFENERFSNANTIKEYIKEISNEKLPIQGKEKIDSDEAMGEFMMLGLRLVGGVDKAEFKRRFGKTIDEVYSYQIKKFERIELLINESSSLKLTHRGLDVANQVMSEFI